VIAAGNVPQIKPTRTTPSIHRLGVFRTCHHERTKSITEANIQAKNTGAKYWYVGATRALGPNAFDDIPLMMRSVIEIR